MTTVHPRSRDRVSAAERRPLKVETTLIAPPEPSRGVSGEAPVWFGDEAAPLSGHWHVPDDGRAQSVVVCAPPIGGEEMAGRRALRHLAEELRRAGHLVLRFDHSGTGDSADPTTRAPRGRLRKSGREPDRRRAELAAALELARATGAPRLAVVGLREGALTAALAATAAGSPALDALVLWDPRGSAGRRVGSHLQSHAATTLVLTPAQADGSAAHATGLGVTLDPETTQWSIARGGPELFDAPPADAAVPAATAGVISWWLDRELGGPSVPVVLGGRDEARLAQPDLPVIRETALPLGSRGGARRALSARLTGPATGPLVVLLGTAGSDRAGPGRAWTAVARRLAAHGRPTVRLEHDPAIPLGDWIAELVEELDHDDVVVCVDAATIPAERSRELSLLLAPRRVALHPVSTTAFLGDSGARVLAIDKLTDALLGYQSPVVDLDALLELGQGGHDPAYTEITETLVVAPPPPGRSRLVPVTVLMLTGLGIQLAAYSAGRSGLENRAQLLFFLGLTIIFVPTAWRLLGASAGRGERLATVCLFATITVLSLHLLSPSIFTGYDELLHEGTLWRLASEHTLFVHNASLPVSPSYPGLELFTLGLHWFTGMPVMGAEFCVIIVSRVVLLLTIFLFTERLTGSTRAGSVSVVVYALSPQFYSFNGAYAYQTLALALGAGALYLVMRAVDSTGRRRTRDLVLAMICTAGVVITHHLVGWITVAALVVWAGALAGPKRREARRTVGRAAVFGVLAVMIWTAIHLNSLYDYLEPILANALSGILGLLGQNQSGQRKLFAADNGIATPLWQKGLLLGSTAIVLTLLVLGIRAVLRNRALTGRPLLRGGGLRLLVVLVAASYLLVLGSRLSGPAAELGGRASTFVFFGIAPVVAAWFVAHRHRSRAWVATGVATVAFLGAVIFGAASWTYVPGPFLPAADERSVDATSISAANWVAAHLPIGTTIAADRDNSVLMGDIGHVNPVTEGVRGGINVGPLYFDTTWGSYDTSLIRKAKIQYLVTDTRLAQGPPAYGVYFEAGETSGPERLSTEQLTKFATVPGFRQVYTNGPITIYDVSALLGDTKPAPNHDAGASPSMIASLGKPDWFVVAAALLAGLAWIVPFARRRPPVDRLLDLLVVGTVVSSVAAAVVIASGVSARWAAVLVLLGLAVVPSAQRFARTTRVSSAESLTESFAESFTGTRTNHRHGGRNRRTGTTT